MSKPQPISGFPEFLPAEQLAFDKARDTIRQVFESFGYIPLDTPVVERSDTLLAKGAAEHEIYGINRLLAGEGEKDKKDLALRFDLTVPLARYVAQHQGHLNFPFRRYHIAPVWRGERPQAGRYRQFYQCDIDVIGDGELPLAYDAEMPAVMVRALNKLNIGDFTIRLNNRKILQGFFAAQGLEKTEDIQAALRIVDDLEKLDSATIEKQLGALLSADAVAATLAFFATKLSSTEWLAKLQSMQLNDTFNEGVQELTEVADLMLAMGVAQENFTVDPTIARGLGYYTGTIYETQLNAHPELGSICSGGRYANLASKFTNRELPGVGMSIGLSRLIIKLFELGIIKPEGSTTAPVLVTAQNADLQSYYLKLGQLLRGAGIGAENYLEQRKLPAQLKYADKRGFKIALIADESEQAAGQVIVKNLQTGNQQTVAKDQLVTTVQAELA